MLSPGMGERRYTYGSAVLLRFLGSDFWGLLETEHCWLLVVEIYDVSIRGLDWGKVGQRGSCAPKTHLA